MAKVKSYAVIGLGVFGMSVARNLSQEGMEVMVIDHNKDLVNSIAPEVTYAIQMDVTNELALKNVGLDRMDGVIIAIGESLEASVMATILCKEMGVPKIIVKAKTDLEKRILEKVGANMIIMPEKESGFRLAKNIAGNFMDFFSLSDKLSIVEFPMKKEWIGKTLRELDVRRQYRLNIIAIHHAGSENPDCYPDPDRPLQAEDLVIAAGENAEIEKL
ncbi:MAG: TrkA family potassium uptake protein [Eubacteriales bacterium]|nr:TrkA family potassium uptake protein [Eubacteriales bacterium]